MGLFRVIYWTNEAYQEKLKNEINPNLEIPSMSSMRQEGVFTFAANSPGRPIERGLF